MAKPRTQKPPRASSKGSSSKTTTALKGGLGDSSASYGAGLDEQLGGLIESQIGRYEVLMPPALQTLRKKMQASGGDKLAQVAESLVAAAYQHQRQPDAGSRLYGRAFQSLTSSDQAKLLAVMSPEDASLVNQSYQNYVEAEQPQTTAPAQAQTREERIKQIAREAAAGLNSTPVVDLDQNITPEAPSQARLPVSKGDEVVTVDGPTAEWTEAQRARGYRKIVYAPANTGKAPRTVIEVVKDRAGEYAMEAPAPALPRANPNYGKTRQSLAKPRQTDATMEVDRITPMALEELGAESRAAAATGAELFDMLEQQRGINPDFDETPAGKRIIDRILDLSDRYPDAVPFMENPGVETYTLPKDVAAPPSGRDALPREMRLGYLIGTPASSAPHKWENRADRRSRFGIPPDAPNRQAWLDLVSQVREIEETKGDGTTRIVKKRVPRSAAEVQQRVGQPGQMGIVGLPFSKEISRGDPMVREATANLELSSGGMRRQQESLPAPAVQPKPVQRVVIAGGRDYADYESLKTAATNLVTQLQQQGSQVVIVSGKARGADTLGEQFAAEMGLKVEEFPADWTQGKGAGHARNAQMAEVADIVLVAPGGRGTDNMIQQATRRKKPVFRVEELQGSQGTVFDDAGGLADDSWASDAEIEEALSESFNDDPAARPLEDRSQEKWAWEKEPERNDYVLQAGTAEGSPAKVQRDRDFALREGKPALEKLQEKLWRASQEFGDVDVVADGNTLGISETQGFDYSADGTGFGDEAIYEATGGGGQIRKRSSGKAPRPGDAKILPLDSLAPIWRSYIEDVDQYGRVTFRRPTPYEVAGVLVDRADMPDPAMASRLEGIVRASMAALEGTPAKGKAARIAGKPYPASQARGRALWGDSKPEYADSALQILSKWKSRQASDAARGFVAEQPSSAGLVADNTGGGEAPPAATNEEAQAAANLFRSVGRGSGPKTTNIATLLAIASGLGAASQTAGAGELPPVEYLAMTKPRTGRSVTALRGKRTKPAAGTPAPAATTTTTQPQPAPAPAAPAPAPAAAPRRSGGKKTKPQAAATPPRKPYFPNSPTAHRVGPLAKAAFGYLPDAALLMGAGAAATAAAPYVIPPVQRGFQYLTGQSPEQVNPEQMQQGQDAVDELFQQLLRDKESREGQQQPQAPALNSSTSNIRALQQMLASNPMT